MDTKAYDALLSRWHENTSELLAAAAALVPADRTVATNLARDFLHKHVDWLALLETTTHQLTEEVR